MDQYNKFLNRNQYMDDESGEMELPDLDKSFYIPRIGSTTPSYDNKFSIGDYTSSVPEESTNYYDDNDELKHLERRKQLSEKYNAIYGDKPKVPYVSEKQYSSLEEQAPAFTRLQEQFKDIPPELIASHLRALTKYGQTTDFGKKAEIGKDNIFTGGMYENQIRSSMDALRQNLKKGRELVEAKSDPLAFDIEQQVKAKQELEDRVQRIKQNLLNPPLKSEGRSIPTELEAEQKALDILTYEKRMQEKDKASKELLKQKTEDQKRKQTQEINKLRSEMGLPLLDEETVQKQGTIPEIKKQEYNYSTGMSAEPIQPVKSYIEDRKRSVTSPYGTSEIPQTRGLKEGEFFISPEDYYENQYQGLSPEDISSGISREPAAKKPSVVVSPEEKKQITGEIESVVGKDKLPIHLAYINKEAASFDKFAKNPKSSSEGLYQINNDAYKDVQRLNSKFKNIPKSEMLKDSKLQAEAYETYMGDIENWIRKNLKTEPTEELKAKIYHQGRKTNKEYNEAADRGLDINGKPLTDDPSREDKKTGKIIPGMTKEEKAKNQRNMGYDGPYAQQYADDILRNKKLAVSGEISRGPSSEETLLDETTKQVPDSVKKAIFAKTNEEFASAMNEVIKRPEYAIDTEKRDQIKKTVDELSELNRQFRQKSEQEQNAIISAQQPSAEPPLSEKDASGISKEIKDYVEAYRKSESENTVDSLREVQERANKLRFFNTLQQSFEKIGSGIAGAMSGYVVKPGEPFKALDVMADTIEAQYKERAAKEGDDPNSQFSKLITNLGNKLLEKSGIKDNPLTGLSGNAATKILPIIKDVFEADIKSNYIKDQKQKEREYKEELIADKEVQKISDNLAKIDRATKSNIAKPRSIVYQIDRMLALTGRNGENIPNLTGAEVLELIGGLDNIMNNQSTVSGRQKLADEFNTLSGDIRDIIRYVSNNPTPRGADEFVKRLYKTILREREIANSQLRHYYGTVMAGISDKTRQMRGDKIDQIFDAYLKPFEYEQTPETIEKNFGLNTGEFQEVKEKTMPNQAGSSEDERAIRWAKEHKDDPVHGETAKQILKANKVEPEKSPEQLKAEDNQALNWSKENINNPKYASMAFNILKHHGIV